MNILVIDGQGGKIGRLLVEAIKAKFDKAEVTVIGTNSTATANMIKGGADNAATGENPVIVGCRKADIVIGPASIAVADSMLGEITPAMAVAVGQSSAVKILIPINKCDNMFIGIEELSITELIRKAVDQISNTCK